MLPARLNLFPLAAIAFGTLAHSAEVDGKHARQSVAAAAECRMATQPLANQKYWRLFHSAHFTICCPPWFDGNAALQRCESLRQTLAKKWLATEVDDWASRCYVVLHPTEATYVQAAGRGSEQTAGCTTVKELNGCVLSRRIDLRLDRPDPLSYALPHELTHVVLADVIVRHRLPRWADEGMAMLADGDEKRRLHGRDLIGALDRGRAFRLAELLALADYPSTSRQQEFYGQSVSLVSFLVKLQTPKSFLQFARAGVERGYDTALREHYGINDVSALERAWLNHSMSKSAPVTVASKMFSRSGS